ncbi:MAG: hypothetical protein PHH08_01765 [Candidatus ainarchaeum sp.]|nr:hypothetical protein [Candidatus ainarchaeum sp.]
MGFFDRIFGGNGREEGLSNQARADWSMPRKGLCKFEVQGSYQIPSVGTVIVGMVREGVLKTGLSCNANEKTGKVRSIERRRIQVAEASAGELVNMSLDGVLKQDISAGDILEFY